MLVADLKQCHLEEACELFAASYHCQREAVPILDESNGRAERILPMLKWCLAKHPGTAVFENGRMIAYMTGFYVDEFLGVHKGALCPEWAHASTNEESFDTHRLMYKALGQKWVEDGCLTHAIYFLNYAREAQDAFVWNGFGSICVDAVRAVEPVDVRAPEGVRITAIREEDIPVWLPLVDGHNRHVAKSPAFKPYLEPESPAELGNTLRQPGNLAWMAWHGSEAVGYMKVAPVEDGTAWIVNGERKFAVNGAYVKPEYRSMGIAKSLLSAVMGWALGEGFVRCSVEFEATNVEACRFWLKHFEPVCRSMVRRLDERILRTL